MKKTLLFTSILMIAGAMNAWAVECAKEGTFGGVTLKTDKNDQYNIKCVATIDATGEDDFEVPEDFSVDKVVFDRTFNAQLYQTVILPISIKNGGSVDGGNMCSLSGIIRYSEHEDWKISCTSMDPKDIVAHVPYIMQAYQSGPITFTAKNQTAGDITIHKTTSDGASLNAFAENWEFRGTYTYKKWETGDSQIGHVYGFAANDKGDNIKAGQFVRVAAGASVKPMRAYLYYNKKSANAGRPAANGVKGFAAIDDEDLPNTIEVVFQDKNGETTSIAQMNTVTGEFTSVTGWYDMKGRKLNKKPTQKGTYFNNGKKVVIK